MIICDALRVVFSPGTRNEFLALSDIDLRIAPGEFITVVGSNGAGKSTLLGCLSADVRPTGGRIRIDGIDVTDQDAVARSKICSRVFQDPTVGTCAELTIEENLALALRRGKSRGLRKALDGSTRDVIAARVKEIPGKFDRQLSERAGSLSGGQRQAISLLMATMSSPRILLLDEHTSALDPTRAEQIVELTRSLIETGNMTAVMVTHSMHQALSLGTRTIVMHRGGIRRILSGGERSSLTALDLAALISDI